MRNIRSSLFSIALLAVPGSVACAGDGASFQGLGDLPGGAHSSIVIGLSADGSTAVGWSTTESLVAGQPQQHPGAFLWTAADGMQPLGTLAPAPGDVPASWARAISADGSTIVGESIQGFSGANENVYAVRWSASAGAAPEVLPDLSDGRIDNDLHDVSADGSVIVGASYDTPSRKRPCIWIDGNVQLLLPSGNTSAGNAYLVSEAGDAIISYTVPGGWQYFTAPDYNSQPLLGPSPFSPGPLVSITPDGSLAVGAASYLGGPLRAITIDLDNAVATALPAESFTPSIALDATAFGSIIVGSGIVDAVDHALIWRAPDQQPRRIADILQDEFAIDLDGWHLIDAVAIAHDGATFVGNGINPAGQPEAWIATLPTPAPSCPANLDDADNAVNVFDLFMLFKNWHADGPGADLAAPNNVVDVFDLFALLGAWGPCE